MVAFKIGSGGGGGGGESTVLVNWREGGQGSAREGPPPLPKYNAVLHTNQKVWTYTTPQ